MTTVAPTITGFDPRSREYYLDPQAALQPLLRETPVFYHEDLDSYYVLSYEEVRRLIASDEVSNHALQPMPVRPELYARIPESWRRAGAVVHGIQLQNLDPPAHTPQRKATQKAFTHRRVQAVHDEIEAIADGLLDDLAPRGECDLMRDFAQQLTSAVIGRLMNLPPDLLAGFQAWVMDVLGLLAPIDLRPEDVTTPDDELVGIYERVYDAYVRYSAFMEERAANPGTDLCSAMLTVTDDDGRRMLSNDDVLSHMVGITAAGVDTTANLIINMVRLFTQHPDQLELVLADPALWDNAVQEGLRRAVIANQMFRITVKDTEVGGVTVPAGNKLALVIAAANADPAMFPDPLRFDVRRANVTEHLGFGRGRHFCLGAALAPPETRLALETLYRRLPGLKADLDQELEFVPSLVVRGIIGQRVTWDV